MKRATLVVAAALMPAACVGARTPTRTTAPPPVNHAPADHADAVCRIDGKLPRELVDPYIGLLYHIDVWALVAAEFVLVAVAMLAMMRPALRATRTDPVDVLRAA